MNMHAQHSSVDPDSRCTEAMRDRMCLSGVRRATKNNQRWTRQRNGAAQCFQAQQRLQAENQRNKVAINHVQCQTIFDRQNERALQARGWPDALTLCTSGGVACANVQVRQRHLVLSNVPPHDPLLCGGRLAHLAVALASRLQAASAATSHWLRGAEDRAARPSRKAGGGVDQGQ